MLTSSRTPTPASRPAANSRNILARSLSLRTPSVRAVNSHGRGKHHHISPRGNHLRCLPGFLAGSCDGPGPRAAFLPALPVAVRGAPCPRLPVPFPPRPAAGQRAAAGQELAPPPEQELCHRHPWPLTVSCHLDGVTAMESSSAPPAPGIAPAPPRRSEAARWYRVSGSPFQTLSPCLSGANFP